MKQALKLLLKLNLILLISSCQKDYPKDIPDWLKDKIKELKKETREYKGGYKGDLPITIDEYAQGSTTTFWLMPGGTPAAYQIYDYDGTYQCFYDPISWTPADTICGNIGNPVNYVFVRRIWEEKK